MTETKAKQPMPDQTAIPPTFWRLPRLAYGTDELDKREEARGQ